MAKLHTNFTGPSTVVPPVEQDIDRYITAHPDGDFDEVLKEDDRWPVFYHLSDMRGGLLGWYELPPDAEVLEIGAGFGALTGQLSDMAGHVTVMEHSLFRARSLAKRWTTRENIDVYAGDLFDMPFRRRFDLITLVGVLPELFEGSAALSPYADYLRALQEYLKPHGRILLAMDNRLGLKFFCGARDAYAGEPFGGLSGTAGGGHLFTAAEIRAIASEAGYAYVRFYYPLPDYRLPQLIFSDAHLPDAAVGEGLIPYDPTSDTRVLSETYLYRHIVANGLFPAMANSFLVECAVPKNTVHGADFISLASDRVPAANIATAIKGRETVMKRPLTAAGREGLVRLEKNMAALSARGLEVVPLTRAEGALSMPFYDFPVLSAWLKERTPGEEGKVCAVFDRLRTAILQASPPVPDEMNFMADRALGADWGVILRRVYVNMVPENIFYDDGRLIFFNQGITLEHCPARYAMFLALYESAEDLTRLHLLEKLRAHFDLDALWDIFVAEQQRFVAEWRRYDVYHQFYDWAEMNPRRMKKNRQLLQIMGSD
ncbi:MAG: class I SAM-dependent methyltransferase [Schwartzia sp. (in: firmicutes)]